MDDGSILEFLRILLFPTSFSSFLVDNYSLHYKLAPEELWMEIQSAQTKTRNF